ncbi:MAG TPA: hypothetical protein VJG13_04680 [Thermoanaerobaculia bacterium]|nr:hypothetical protein [Thermoanaerobaculia bacterium]
MAVAKGKGGKPPKKQVIVAGPDGKLYKLDAETGSLTALDRGDPIRRHARRLLKQGVITADVKPPKLRPDEAAAFFISYFYHLINLASLEEPDADDE